MNTPAIYSATTLHPLSLSTTPRISGFWATTPPQYIEGFAIFIRTSVSLSIIFCVLSLITLIGRKKYKTLAKKNLISFIGTVLISDTSVLSEVCNWNLGLDYVECYAVAVISHWAELSTVTWMNVLAIDIWRASFKIESHDALRENHQTKRFVFYGLYAWGLSALFVCISVVIDHLNSVPVQYKPGYVDDDIKKCWASTWKYVTPDVIYSIVPLMILVVTSLFFLFLTYINVRKTTNLVESVFRRQVRKRFMLYVNVTVIRDVGFIVGYIPLWNTWYIIVTLFLFGINSLLGVYLFVLFVFNKKKVKSEILTRIRCAKSNIVDGR